MDELKKKNPVVIVAIEEEDNLGVRYIASVLIKAGYVVKILDFQLANWKIYNKIIEFDSLIIGFSIIFQSHIHKFADLIKFLRSKGISCHFTAGGQYPSLRPKELFELIPDLNSIVLFEGEYTFLELVKSIYNNNKWKKLNGICYKENGSIVTNPLRGLEKDLDKFPIPFRPGLMTYALGKKYATLIAGRGCYHNCTFCNTRSFYSKPPGPVKRIRKPELVVREMKLLYKKFGCTIFIFQDDDFPVGGTNGRKWAEEFCYYLNVGGFSKKILWKINCRPDEFEEETFQLMKTNGLFMVFLGIEDGTIEGLKRMNKKTTPQQALHAVDAFKKMGVTLNFGFILFQPSSTFKTIQVNLKYLKQICKGGFVPLSFLRMIPYYETRLEEELRESGRLKEKAGLLTYNFLDPALEHFYDFVSDSFNEWLNHRYGLLNISKWILSYTSVYEKYYSPTPEYNNMVNTAHQIISKNNNFFFKTLESLIDIFNESNNYQNNHILEKHRINIANHHQQYNEVLKSVISNLEGIVRYRHLT